MSEYLFIPDATEATRIQSAIDAAYGYPRTDSRTDHAVGIIASEGKGYLIPLSLSVFSHSDSGHREVTVKAQPAVPTVDLLTKPTEGKLTVPGTKVARLTDADIAAAKLLEPVEKPAEVPIVKPVVDPKPKGVS